MMQRQPFWLMAIAFLLLISSTVAIGVTTAHRAPPASFSAAVALTDTPDSIGWDVIGGGMGEMSSAGYRVRGTIGQPVIGTAQSTRFALRQGFWQSFLTEIRTYLPSIRK